MSVSIFAVPLLLIMAIVNRLAGTKRPHLIRMVTVMTALLVMGLLTSSVVTSPVTSGSWWRDDMIGRGCLATAATITLIVALLETSPILLAATCWSAGLLCLAGLSSLLVVQWAAIQFSIIPLLFYCSESRSGPEVNSRWRSVLAGSPQLTLGSLLYGIGFVLLAQGDSTSSTFTIGLILNLCGLGGMLGWFPFPHVAETSSDSSHSGSIFGKRFLPAMSAAVVTCRMIERNSLGPDQSNLLILAAFFSLGLLGFRLVHEDRVSRRVLLSVLSTFSFLLVAIFIQNWAWTHSGRNWQLTSNLPSGGELFVSIMICETMALLAVVAGGQLLGSETESGDYCEALSGVATQKPVQSLCLILGLMSLAGIPPFPGFWWRLMMPGLFLLPHRQSNVTEVMEADHSTMVLGCVAAAFIILHAVGHLQWLHRLLLDSPFRIRDVSVGRRQQLAAGIALIFLGIAFFAPLSISKVFEADPVFEVSTLPLSQSELTISNEDPVVFLREVTGM